MSIRLLCAAAAALAFGATQAQPLQLKVLGQPVGSGLIQKNKEQPFFEKLAAATGLNVSVQYVPVDVAGIPDTDGLRVLRSGLFNIVSIRGPQVSRDEPTILGFDLVGPDGAACPEVQCSLDGARRSAASVVTAQYVTLRQLMLSLPTVARVLEVTCDV